MATASTNAIDLFAMPLDRLAESVSDTNRNDNYVLKENVMEELTTIPTKIDDNIFALRFTYK